MRFGLILSVWVNDKYVSRSVFSECVESYEEYVFVCHNFGYGQAIRLTSQTGTMRALRRLVSCLSSIIKLGMQVLLSVYVVDYI